MNHAIISALVATLLCMPVYGAEREKYPVPSIVSQVEVKRVGDVLFRYIEFFEDYPCIRFETLRRITHERIDSIEACTFSIDKESIDVRREDLAGVGYHDYRVHGEKFYFTAEIILGGTGPGLPPLDCEVTIDEKGNLSGPVCARRD